MTKEELFDEIVAEAKRDGDIVGTCMRISFSIDYKVLTVSRHVEGKWRWWVGSYQLQIASGIEADIYAAIESGKEWIAHAK